MSAGLANFLSQKSSYFLAILLGISIISTKLVASSVLINKTIDSYEIEKNVDQLLLLIQKRLVIMHEVARTKWNQNLPIEDKAREQQILTDLVEKAHQYGLEEKWIAKFFQAQMDAAKEIQKNDFSLWREQNLQKFEAVLSLKDGLRSYIDRINQEMIDLLSKIHERKGSIEGRFILEHPISTRASDNIENNIWLLATLPLIEKMD